MPSANNTSNSSNIKSDIFYYQSQSEFSSRLIVNITLQNPSSFNAGDVIRYDIASAGYTKSCADTAPNSEVFGIIESKDDNIASVVTYGSINYPESYLINLTGVNYGGNDIYFLSDTIPGKISNLPPSEVGKIIKPVYQIAPHISIAGANGTGIVMNYLGYVIQSKE